MKQFFSSGASAQSRRDAPVRVLECQQGPQHMIEAGFRKNYAM
jgi:hypothetical protein